MRPRTSFNKPLQHLQTPFRSRFLATHRESGKAERFATDRQEHASDMSNCCRERWQALRTIPNHGDSFRLYDCFVSFWLAWCSTHDRIPGIFHHDVSPLQLVSINHSNE